MGLVYTDKKQYDRAIKYFEQAEKFQQQLRGQIHLLFNSMGIAYDQKKNWAKAEEYYNLSIKAN